MEKVLSLLDQLIARSRQNDINICHPRDPMGEDFMTYHLKALKCLISETLEERRNDAK